MNKKKLIVLIIISLTVVISLFLWYNINYGDRFEYNYVLNRDNVIILDQKKSPNNKYEFVEYQFDTGGLGYSRVFWSVAKANSSWETIFENSIPDGYKIVGWDEDNVLVLEKWEPYYYIKEDIDLTKENSWKGFSIKIK